LKSGIAIRIFNLKRKKLIVDLVLFMRWSI
jgi:hypothetical protein